MFSYKNILIFAPVKTAFFSSYKIVDSENSPDNYKTLKIGIRTTAKNPEMLKFVRDHLRTKVMCKNAVNRLAFVVMYVPDGYKTEEMCDEGILRNHEMLRFIPYCYENQ